MGGGALLVVGALVTLVVLMHARREAKPWELMPVVEALERHENDNGQYPNALADLVPNYLREDPPTKLSYTPNPELPIREDGDPPGEHPGYQLRYCLVFPGRDYPESNNGFFLNEVFDSGWALYVT